MPAILTASRLLWGAFTIISLGLVLVLTLGEQPVQGWPHTDFSRFEVPLEEFQKGGPMRDGIPALDAPVFEAAEAAASWLHGLEPVIALARGDEARAYPLRILLHHEIVNDSVAGQPVVVTYCPLCDAARVYDRRPGGGGSTPLTFGTTGLLRQGALVMYDRQTESWWQQFTGSALVGTLSGTRLLPLPSQVVAFRDFRETWPTGRVLSQQTGHQRPYGRNPYRNYDRPTGKPMFIPQERLDTRWPPMERVLALSRGGQRYLYPFGTLEQQRVVNVTTPGEPVVVLARLGVLSALDKSYTEYSRPILSAAAFEARLGDGRILTFTGRDHGIYDRQTGSRWNHLGLALEGPLAGTRLRQCDEGVQFAFIGPLLGRGGEQAPIPVSP
ncbi:MAG: DUF3179 domain-containing protein [Magnetococcus sp. WYHC-3]